MVNRGGPAAPASQAAAPSTVGSAGVAAAGRGSGAWFLARGDLGRLVDALAADGRTVIGPMVADGTIVLDQIRSAEDLPTGVGDEQAPGRYRLVGGRPGRSFGFTVGPVSPKRWAFPPAAPLSTGRRDGPDVSFMRVRSDPAPMALLGLRACELAAIAVQDRVLLDGPSVDEDYRARRAAMLLVAVECSVAGDTCFCTSMGSGPEVGSGCDLALSELEDGFLVRAVSPAGADLLVRLPVRLATPAEVDDAAGVLASVRESIGEPVAVQGLHDRLLAQYDSPRWTEIAERCLTCANCTLVCPTCFCHSIVQRTDLDGMAATAERVWDSCFTAGFARVAGGSFRSRPRDRYRQWLTHKFATWIDQFGTAGCVGCGRCITWCPVGIDVREELAAVAPPFVSHPGPVTPPVIAATPGEFVTARILRVQPETSDVATLTLSELDPAFLAGRPGQFAMVVVPGFPPLPISISRFGRETIELTVRAAGPATAALIAKKPGEALGLRGPLGSSWPIDRAVGHDVIIVTGGIGFAPLRSVLDEVIEQRHRFGTVRLYYGARTPGEHLYAEDLRRWGRRNDIDVELTVDRADESWGGPVGVVTRLFDRATWDGSRATAFVCGPERMMAATAEVLEERGVASSRIFVTLERHMECGIGLCGHCQVGRLFVCRDGPVFSMAQVGDLFGREGI